MTDTAIDRVADALIQARRDGRATDAAPLADALRSADEAYAVQARVAAAFGWDRDGAAPAWKSGAASPAATPTHAALPPAGVWASPATADAAMPLRLRGIEAEVALRLGGAVDAARVAALTDDHVAELIDAMTVSIELIESRWREQLDAPALLKLADLQSHGALVLGSWRPFEPGRDWSAQTCTVRIGGQPPIERRGAHSLGDPARVVLPWLRHATRDGATLPAGTVLTTGTWIGIPLAAAGDRVEVRFDGVGEAALQL